MSTVGSFDKTQHFAELLTPLVTNAGVLTPTQRQAAAFANLAANGIAGFRHKSATYLYNQGTPAAKTTSTTLTAAELLTGIVTGLGGAAVAYTLPLATAIETALLALFPALAVDDAFEFVVINTDTTGANTITVTTNTGWTLVGDMVLAGNTAGDESSGTFRARRTAANTYTLYRI